MSYISRFDRQGETFMDEDCISLAILQNKYVFSFTDCYRFQDFCSMNNFWLPEKRDNLRKSLSLLSISAEKKKVKWCIAETPLTVQTCFAFIFEFHSIISLFG